jgi:hypothetical protein
MALRQTLAIGRYLKIISLADDVTREFPYSSPMPVYSPLARYAIQRVA